MNKVSEFERRKAKGIPTLASNFDSLWRELVTTFRSEIVYLSNVHTGRKYSIQNNKMGGFTLVRSHFARGYHGMSPFTYEHISDSEYNEVESDFDAGVVGVFWIRGGEHVELHRATGIKLN